MKNTLSIGIVIPARNEESNILQCLSSLRPFREQHDRIVVINACSTDATAALARDTGTLVLDAPVPDRGFVVEMGVKYFTNSEIAPDVLLIAHADMVFQSESRARLTERLEKNPAAVWGCYGHRIRHRNPLFRLVEWGNNQRAKYVRIPYGDQAQFFKTSVLNTINGFPHQTELEDLELSLRLKQQETFVYLDYPVWIPARHWKDGIVKTTLRNWMKVGQYIRHRKS